MSIHFTVSELTRNLFHSLGLDHERAPRPLNPEQNLLLECYLAGQIPESAWSDDAGTPQACAAVASSMALVRAPSSRYCW